MQATRPTLPRYRRGGIQVSRLLMRLLLSSFFFRHFLLSSFLTFLLLLQGVLTVKKKLQPGSSGPFSGRGSSSPPTSSNALLTNFRLSSDAEVLLGKRRPSIANRRQNVRKRARIVYTFRPSFHSACHRWRVGSWFSFFFPRSPCMWHVVLVAHTHTGTDCT